MEASTRGLVAASRQDPTQAARSGVPEVRDAGAPMKDRKGLPITPLSIGGEVEFDRLGRYVLVQVHR